MDGAPIAGAAGTSREALSAPRSSASTASSRTSSAFSGDASIGEGVQILRPFVVQAASASTTREYERGQQALARVRVNPADRFPGWTIVFRPAKAGLLGMTLVQERRVEIFVRLDRPIDGIAHDIAHEFGHVTDVIYNDDETRASYLALRNRPAATPWWTCNGCRDLQVGAGDFAETFAVWAGPKFSFYSELAPRPTDEAMRSFVALLPASFGAE